MSIYTPKEKGETKEMKVPSKKELKKEVEKMKKIGDCYLYLLENAGDEGLRKRIDDLAREHLLSKQREIQFSVDIPVQNRLHELEELKKKKLHEQGENKKK